MKTPAMAGRWLVFQRQRVQSLARARRYPGRNSLGVDHWASAAQRHELESAAESDFARLFFAHRGRPVAKWTPYLDAYDTHMSRFRGSDVGLLEIGVLHGGSLQLWRKFLGPGARILGVDIDPACAERVEAPNRVLIGSQDDPTFLRGAAAALGRLDVVVDDGSHVAEHQLASFEVLFDLLAPGGLYVIEDVHTAYWYAFGGGRGRPGTAVDLVRRLVDDMHGWHHDAHRSTPAREWVQAVHVYDSLVVIEKARRSPPLAVMSGTDG